MLVDCSIEIPAWATEEIVFRERAAPSDHATPIPIVGPGPETSVSSTSLSEIEMDGEFVTNTPRQLRWRRLLDTATDVEPFTQMPNSLNHPSVSPINTRVDVVTPIPPPWAVHPLLAYTVTSAPRTTYIPCADEVALPCWIVTLEA